MGRRSLVAIVAKVLLFSFAVASISDVNGQADSSASEKIAEIDAPTGVSLLRVQPGNLLLNKAKLKTVSVQPFISVQQLLKGTATGVYVQEPSGEPGTDQNVFIRGISGPLLSKAELFDQQAAVYLNGIPLSFDNPFAYEVQKYDFNRIGPATNLLTTINYNNIESIEVITDPVTLAGLGPYAAKGAIWITTKNARSNMKQLTVNSYAGLAFKERITPVNAAYEYNFRLPFYTKYGTTADFGTMPAYIRDSTNSDYYGPANWGDVYYRNGILYNLDVALTGGTDRANFRFFTGATRNSGNTDNNSLDRFAGSFFINVKPTDWLTISSMLNYTRLIRERNLNIRDRLGEQRYIPSLVNPLTPTTNLYNSYLREFDKVIDNNSNNAIQGYVTVKAGFGKFDYEGRIAFDYNDGLRDCFWPTTLLEGNNFISNYFGYNQRINITNTVRYQFKIGDKQLLKLQAGQAFMADVFKYDYAYAYNSPNDFIQLNTVKYVDGVLTPENAQIVPYFAAARLNSTLASFHGSAQYSFNNKLSATVLVRRDGSSNMQPNARWFTSYAAGLGYQLIDEAKAALSNLNVNASWARIGKLISDDRFNNGPYYRPDLGWGNQPTLGTYVGIPGLTRPYTGGWVGYDIPWAFSDQFNVGATMGLWNNRVSIKAEVYNRNDKNMLLPVPVPAEWGYTGAYKSGMEVNNKGVELAFSGQVIQSLKNGFGWNTSLLLSYNQNKLVALPGGIDELVIGNNFLKVGERVDAFWLLTNNGIYNNDSEVPVQGNKKLNFNGVPLKGGDPKWTDLNGDNIINDADKTLMGNYMPKITGGFNNTLQYKSWAMDLHFYFALGRKVLNQYAASRLDFINTETNNDINSVKEITFWEKKMDLSVYPQYNPWSDVIAFRKEQDLFLDDASFLKLRSVTVSYTFSTSKINRFFQTTGVKNRVVYVTANNMLTITGFKADDPELAGYNGIYNGYGLPMPKSVIVGIKMDL